MRYPTLYYILIILSVCTSCSEKSKTEPKDIRAIPSSFLPFQHLELKDMSAFTKSTDNWKIVGNVHADKSEERALIPSKGNGVLVNLPEEGKNGNLFTILEHGDIEMELDVMIPLRSNSGLYFQGRYEVQLFDSWGTKLPAHSDMGGIYQRWDSTREKGKEGYEGYPPKTNAAKAPGLWQHFKILFHAPSFDSQGNKTRNARFEEVWLNGVLIHENVELSGPTRAAAFENEEPIGPFMIQGDHGPVALKNIRYKRYGEKRVHLINTIMKEYENSSLLIPNLDSLVPIREIQTDSMSATMATGERSQKILEYSGNFKIPDPGDYLFDLKLNGAGGRLLIGRDTLIDLDGNYNLDSLGLKKKFLQKGDVPFTLIYNKHWATRRGFSLHVEGPGIQRHPLHASGSLDLSQGRPEEDITIKVFNEPIAQRNFWMHENSKRTHCISVGMPQGIHYTYDLGIGALLQVWNGDFIDVTQMWYGRGKKQLASPLGFTVSFHGHPEFAFLENDESGWPNITSPNMGFKPLGYEFNEQRVPVFFHQVKGTTITNKITPLSKDRGIKRTIKVNGNKDIWHKIGEGSHIEKLPDGTFIINDESYFVDFSRNGNLEPMVRNVSGNDELLVKIPAGEQKVVYDIVW